MDDSFTRSLYIGRDKALEVARRREEVEKELKARREAKIREHNERIARAAQQKEQELKEKIRQRHEKELQRQRAVLDRRCAQLEQDKAKKAKILQKAHNSASRPSQVQRKAIYAFGSSTPRAPTYLDTPRNYITKEFSASSERLGSPGTSGTADVRFMRTPSRIMGGSPAITTSKAPRNAGVPAAMTRSVFGRLTTTAAATTRPSATTVSLTGGSSGGRRTTTSTNSSNNEGSSGGESGSSATTRRTTPSIMTQSMYEGKRNTPAKKTTPPRVKPTPTRAKASPTRNVTTNKGSKRPVPPFEIGKATSTPSTSAVNRPPPIRPRKAMEKKPDVSTNQKPEHVQAPVPPVEASGEPAGHLADELASMSLQESSQATPANNSEIEAVAVAEPPAVQLEADNATEEAQTNVIIEPATTTTTTTEKWDYDSRGCDAPLEPSAVASIAESEVNSSTNSSTGNLLMAGTKEEWDSGHESNCAIDLETTPTSIGNKDDISDPFSLPTPKAGSVEENDAADSGAGITEKREVSEVESSTAALPKSANSVAAPTPTPPPTVAAAAALDAEEKDRESRRQKLLEILQRTRNSGNPSTPNNSTASLSGMSTGSSDGLPIRKISGGTGGIDASALAQDLLAQRRQKLQGMTANNNNNNSTTTTIASIMSATSVGGGTTEKPSIFNLESDLNSSGFYENENTTGSTIIGDTSTFIQQRLNAVFSNNGIGNNNNVGPPNFNANSQGDHFRENTLVQLPGEVISHVEIIRQQKQKNDVKVTEVINQPQQPSDPEDPQMEKHEQENGNGTARAESSERIQDTALTASN